MPPTKGSAAVAAGRQLRILCLHGHGQTPTMFREKTGGFRKGVKRWVEWTFLAAPHSAAPSSAVPLQPPLAPESSSPAVSSGDAHPVAYAGDGKAPTDDAVNSEHGLSWYNFSALAHGTTEGQQTYLASVQQSLDAIEDMCVREGPFDGLFGFSQGASLTALVLALAQVDAKGSCDTPTPRTDGGEANHGDTSTRTPTHTHTRDATGAVGHATDSGKEDASESNEVTLTLGPHTSFSFGIMAAGFVPGENRSVAHLDYARAVLAPVFTAAAPIQTPTLHIYGDTDRVIPPSRSQHLASLFATQTTTVLPHGGGHHVPSAAEARHGLRRFLEEQRAVEPTR
eukprot:m.44501 g.44501  ORF g.44501 m.44501 type:complete len:340 (-) comp6533_c1_seq1:29-1048(-)